jgi:hypothetical protein
MFLNDTVKVSDAVLNLLSEQAHKKNAKTEDAATAS